MSGTFVWTSNTSAGSSVVPAFLPSASITSTVSVSAMMSSRSLRGGTHEDDAALGTRNGSLDEHQALRGIDRVNGQVLGGLTLVAHPTGHLDALEHPGGGRGGADGARLAVVAVRTVGGAVAVEAVALHHAREALALGGAGDVDHLAGFEGRHGDLLAECVLGCVGDADLGHVTARGDPGLLEVVLEWLGDLARVDLAIGELDRGVSVVVHRAHLGDHVDTDGDDGDRDEATGLIPHLRHAELGTEQCDHGHGLLGKRCHREHPSQRQSLISMFTSAGRSSRMSESTALGVGSMMSMSRLWVRISKCSRLSLYLWGDRMTQKTFFSVGRGTGPTTVAPARVTVSTILRAELSMTSWSYDLSRMRIFCPAMCDSLSLMHRGRACALLLDARFAQLAPLRGTDAVAPLLLCQ